MKKVMMIFYAGKSGRAIESLHGQLRSIFEEFIEIEDVYLNEAAEDAPLTADAYMIDSRDMLQHLRNSISDYSKILVINKSVNEGALSPLSRIPDGEAVLVVNDSAHSSLQTVYNLYELGFNNLRLIPFDAGKPVSDYEGITTAITPNEERLVPPDIENVINIGDREFSFDTLIRLLQILEITNSHIYKNLLLRMRSAGDYGSGLYTKYLREILKDQFLARIISNDGQAVVLCGIDNRIMYMNPKSEELFGSNVREEYIGNLFDFSSLREGDYAETETEISGKVYSVDKSPIRLMSENIGFSYTFQPYRDKSRSHKSGMYARYAFDDIIHRSQAMKDLISMAKDIAKTDYTISITGETGTGKEMIAQSIHNYSLRKDRPFVAINCAALTDSLLNSELFGYEKGSFTGADSRGKSGLFEQAHGGTIFLDEIGDISPHVQLRLLRAIQEKQIMKVGGTKFIDIDVRIIAATNKNLEEEVLKGNFRNDLFYRLNVIPIHVPPLRERRSDVLPLFEVFVGGKFADLTEREKRTLMNYSWPGNIRQLKNVATYFRALSALPDLSGGQKTEYSACPSNGAEVMTEEALSQYVLTIISENSLPYRGIGRSAIIKSLRERSVRIGEGKLREILKDLSRRGFIEIHKGRTGSIITASGREYLDKRGTATPPHTEKNPACTDTGKL